MFSTDSRNPKGRCPLTLPGKAIPLTGVSEGDSIPSGNPENAAKLRKEEKFPWHYKNNSRK